MSKRILSVSYHEELLITRRMLLEREGYEVTSALGFTQSVARCKAGGFDLFILGHSIPDLDKDELIKAFRNANSAPVVSLQRHGELPVHNADFEVPVDDPAEFLKTVGGILGKGLQES
jgi:DNA-binding response OmpR family regulator